MCVSFLTRTVFLLQDDCQNYIRVAFKKNDEELFVCGTNAFHPMCKMFNLIVSRAVCSYRMRFPSHLFRKKSFVPLRDFLGKFKFFIFYFSFFSVRVDSGRHQRPRGNGRTGQVSVRSAAQQHVDIRRRTAVLGYGGRFLRQRPAHLQGADAHRTIRLQTAKRLIAA